ncbi:MAG TPA: protein-glutamate O-methyltransferase CheR [Vicinamibacteria bacterium]|nr:protein-glutamate O-methyltransferase CheR [Vicinamibacteria bacterium]
MRAGARAPASEGLEDLEIRLLLEGVWSCYGYDFRDYALTSIRRRVRFFMEEEGLSTVTSVQDRVLHDPLALRRFLRALSVNVTAMFRDPSFYRALREVVVPVMRTYPAVRIWHAGCATGEEVYSVAILLREEGLYDRCRLYATDINDAVLRQAQRGELPLSSMRENTRHYIDAGGGHGFARWYKTRDDRAVLDPELRRNIVFAQHNLATDGSFNDFHLVVCRNVLIYFNRALQDRVHRLLYDSLVRFGFLGLGLKETTRFTPHEAHYEELPERLYRKVA